MRRGFVFTGMLLIWGCSDSGIPVEEEETCYHGDVAPGTILGPICRTDSYVLVVPDDRRAVFHLAGPERPEAEIVCVIEFHMPEPLGRVEKAFWIGGAPLELNVEPGYYDLQIRWLVPEFDVDNYAIQIRSF